MKIFEDAITINCRKSFGRIQILKNQYSISDLDKYMRINYHLALILKPLQLLKNKYLNTITSN